MFERAICSFNEACSCVGQSLSVLSTSVVDSSFPSPESRAGSRSASFGSAAGALRVADGAILGWAPRWVGTGSVSVFFSVRAIADESMSLTRSPIFGAVAVQKKNGAEERERTRGASVLCSGECTLRDGTPCAKRPSVGRAVHMIRNN